MDTRIKIGDALDAVMMANYAVLGQRQIAHSGAWIVRRDACECWAGRDDIGEILGIYFRAGVIGVGVEGDRLAYNLGQPHRDQAGEAIIGANKHGSKGQEFATAVLVDCYGNRLAGQQWGWIVGHSYDEIRDVFVMPHSR